MQTCKSTTGPTHAHRDAFSDFHCYSNRQTFHFCFETFHPRLLSRWAVLPKELSFLNGSHEPLDYCNSFPSHCSYPPYPETVFCQVYTHNSCPGPRRASSHRTPFPQERASHIRIIPETRVRTGFWNVSLDCQTTAVLSDATCSASGGGDELNLLFPQERASSRTRMTARTHPRLPGAKTTPKHRRRRALSFPRGCRRFEW